MAFLGDLVAEVRAGTQFLVQDERIAAQLYSKIERHGKTAMLAIAGATTAAVTASTLFTIEAAKATREMANQARAAGVSTTKFQEMAVASRRFGIDQAKVSDILRDVNDRIGDFVNTGGGPMLDFFEQIAPRVGVTVEQFKRLNSADALQLYVSTLEKANASQAEMTFFMEAIASDASLLTPILRDNGRALAEMAEEAHNLGVILGQDTVDQLLSTEAALDDIALTVEGFKNLIASEMAPALGSFADNLNHVLRESDDVRSGVQNMAGAYGDLLSVLSSEEVISTAVGALEGLAVITSGTVEFVVALSDNVEILTISLGALAIGLAAIGGPLTLIVGALGGALVGIAHLRAESDALTSSAGLTEQAEIELATALKSVEVAGGNAVAVGRQVIESHISEARAAVVAAQAELELARAREASGSNLLEANPLTAGGQSGYAEAMADVTAQAEAELTTREEQVARLGKMLEGFEMSRFPTRGATNPEGDPETPGSSDSGTGTDTDMQNALDEIRESLMSETEVIRKEHEERQAVINAAFEKGRISSEEHQTLMEELETAHQQRLSEILDNGGGGSGGGLTGRLEKLQNSFLTERELVQEEYEIQQEVLRSALENELITREMFHELMLAAEQDFQKKMGQIKKDEKKEAEQVTGGMLDNLASLTRSGNKTLFEIGKAASIANAIVKGREAITSSYAAGAKLGGPPLGTAFAATAALATAAQISELASSSFSGGGSVSSGIGGGGSVPTEASSQSDASGGGTNVNVSLVGEGDFSDKQVRQLIETISEVLEDGGTLSGITVN